MPNNRNSQSIPLEVSVEAATQWFRRGRGRLLLEQERLDIDEALSCLFGYHLCQISACQALDLTASSRITHTFALHPMAEARVGKDAASCDFHRLPLAPQSVDVFLLHHALDFSQTPHQLLAEATRATIARGHLVIVGFNPWSLGGIWRWLKGLTSSNPLWQQQHLRLARLSDWFALLELELLEIKRGPLWPVADAPQNRFGRALLAINKMMRRLNMPWGDYYVAIVRKDVLGAIPVKPHWSTVPVPQASSKLGNHRSPEGVKRHL